MDKVWFKLKQTHYPPPTVFDGMENGRETGPICLGHYMENLKHIDFVLNRNEILAFPANMPVYKTTAVDFIWDSSHSTETGGEAGAGADAVVPGVTFKANVRALFKNEVANYEEYEKLDTHIVQITKPYVAECFATVEALTKYEKKKTMWSLFVITGLMVARRAKKMVASESREREFEGGPEVDLAGIGSATLTPKIVRNKAQKMENSGASDFVFAVRLARITKNILQADWSVNPFTKKATFDAGKEKIDVESVVFAEGMENVHVIEDENLERVLVMDRS